MPVLVLAPAVDVGEKLVAAHRENFVVGPQVMACERVIAASFKDFRGVCRPIGARGRGAPLYGYVVEGERAALRNYDLHRTLFAAPAVEYALGGLDVARGVGERGFAADFKRLAVLVFEIHHGAGARIAEILVVKFDFKDVVVGSRKRKCRRIGAFGRAAHKRRLPRYGFPLLGGNTGMPADFKLGRAGLEVLFQDLRLF